MPLSMFTYTMDYVSDKTGHRFWSKNASKVCNDEENIRGNICIVTGSNCGIGKVIASELAKRQAVVIMAVRDMEKGRLAKLDIEREYSYSVVVVKRLDLGELASIYEFVKEFQKHYDHLNLLVNNAGVMSTEKRQNTTKDGFELHVGVNHLGTFLLTKLLLEACRKGAPSRVVTIASSNLSIATIDFDDFMMEGRVKKGDGYREQYNISKLAIALCIRKLVSDLRKSDDGWKQVKFYLMCPGYVRTPLFRNDEGCCRKCKTKMSLCTAGISVHKGAETACYLCLSKSVADGDDVGNAEMYRFMKVWKRGENLLKELDGSEEMDRLYKMTEHLLGLDADKQKEASKTDKDSKDDT